MYRPLNNAISPRHLGSVLSWFSLHRTSVAARGGRCKVTKKLVNYHILNDFHGLMCVNWRILCIFAVFFGTRHIETTKRYARLAIGNVRNFLDVQGRCMTVRAYSVDWFLHLHIKVILTTSYRRRGTSAPRFCFEAKNVMLNFVANVNKMT